MICHSLSPPNEKGWLSPADVVARLESRSVVIFVIAASGIADARKILERLNQMGAPAGIIDQLERTYEDALELSLSGPTDSGTVISFVVMPRNPIKIYHEPDPLPTVEYCRSKLGYVMEEI